MRLCVLIALCSPGGEITHLPSQDLCLGPMGMPQSIYDVCTDVGRGWKPGRLRRMLRALVTKYQDVPKRPLFRCGMPLHPSRAASPVVSGAGAGVDVTLGGQAERGGGAAFTWSGGVTRQTVVLHLRMSRVIGTMSWRGSPARQDAAIDVQTPVGRETGAALGNTCCWGMAAFGA